MARFTEAEKGFIRQQRVVRLATLSPDGGVHVVPLCFAFDGENTYIHARRTDTRRMKNLARNNTVSLEFDHYSDDWSQLRGILVYGKGELIRSGPEYELGLKLLLEKYPQYRSGEWALTKRIPLARISPTRVVSWFVDE